MSDLLGDTLKLDNEEFHSDGESPACRQALEHQHRQRIMQYVPHVEIAACSKASYITDYGIKQVEKFTQSIAILVHLFLYCIEIFMFDEL